MKKRFLLFALLSIVLAVTGCARVASKPAAKRSPATQASRPTPRKSAGPLAMLARASRGMTELKSFRSKSTVTISGGGLPDIAPQEMVIEFVAPDRMHVSSAMMEMYIIEGYSYMKMGGEWKKTPIPKGTGSSAAPTDSSLGLTDPKKLAAAIRSSTKPKFVGREVLDGAPTLVFEYTATVPMPKLMPTSSVIKMPTSMRATSKMWIGADDGLPHKMESKGKMGDLDFNVVATYYGWNTDISVEPPI